MPIYTDPIPGAEYIMHYYLEDGYHHVLFKCNGELHRTDGPAIIKWNYRETKKLYYLKEIRISEDTFMEVYNAPIEDMPLWINSYRGDIAKAKLKGERTSICTQQTEYITKRICEACNIDPQCVIDPVKVQGSNLEP